jgi:hypothetical protein
MNELWVVACFFNPARYKTKSKNYFAFRNALRQQQVPLLTVELADRRNPFELGKDDADVLVHLRTDSVMWQKERLYNLTLDHLPAECRYIAFLDADILFTELDWVARSIAELERVPIIQPFSHVVRMREGDDWLDPRSCPTGTGEGQIYHAFAYGTREHGPDAPKIFSKHGYTGYGWVWRRDLVAAHGWYDAAILGGGDALLAHAIFNNREADVYRELTPAQQRHYDEWASRFYEEVRGRVSYISGAVLHRWHGSRKDRRYRGRQSRARHLEAASFDPQIDICQDEMGLWKWASQKPDLERAVIDYFAGRNEDGGASDLSAKVMKLLRNAAAKLSKA